MPANRRDPEDRELPPDNSNCGEEESSEKDLGV
jgi:hypothetical protein